MTSDQVKALHTARPFKPFTLNLAGRDSVHISHPEILFLTQGGRTIFVNTKGENVEISDLLLVTKISVGNGASRQRRR